ncbi:hypothetical protein ACH4PU_32045 [Streptomyces sp. NPDC021100]|uniref:hypothetical protein n=1 Tax=Streptomyces sp. NPDC021100 TaxID=3365114 RepID=UPI003794E057
MSRDNIGEFQLKLSGLRVLPGAHNYEASAAGEGRIAGIEVFAIFTHVSQILPDGSEIATSDGFLRAKEGCDTAFVQLIGGFRCEREGRPGGAQHWQGAAAIKSESPRFMELNGRVFWLEIRFDPQAGTSHHRWYALRAGWDDGGDDGS